MSYITVPSILKPTELAYKLTSDVLDSHRNRGERPLIECVRAYQTYGDGTTQHSGDWATQFGDIEDVCLSLATAIIADPKNPEWRSLDYTFEGHFKRADIEFARTVRFKDDGKVRFFSMDEHKFTASDKRHDRRYERVEPRHDGSEAAVFYMIWKEYQSWIIRVRLAYEIAEIGYGWASHTNMGYIFEPIKNLPDTWIHAFEALVDSWRASMLLRRREHTLTVLAENRQRLIELAAAKKDTEAAA